LSDDDLAARAPSGDLAPRMFARQSDVPDPLPSVRHSGHMAKLHREWDVVAATAPPDGSSPRDRIVRTTRRIVHGPNGVTDVMLADMIRALDAVAERCDEISERLTHLQIVVDDVATIFGEELTRLRAESASSGGGELGNG
jgi:hypothetical protein